MTAGINDWSALTAQAAVVLNGFLPWIALVVALGLLWVLGMFFAGLFGGGGGGGRFGRRGSSAAVAAAPAAPNAPAARAAHRRVKASGVAVKRGASAGSSGTALAKSPQPASLPGKATITSERTGQTRVVSGEWRLPNG